MGNKLTIIYETEGAALTHIFSDTTKPEMRYRRSDIDNQIDGVKLEFVPTAVDGQFVEIIDGMPEPRDEYHTMAEIYHYRMLYNAHAAVMWKLMGYEVVKSTRHSNGELCFGGGYFIVTVQLPTGQVSNHYKMEYIDLFRVPEVRVAPPWDGHTPEIAANRLYNFMTGSHLDVPK